MNRGTWNKFVKARDRFRLTTEELLRALPELKDIQQKLADSRCEGKNHYDVKTPVVYNSALDDITEDDDIKMILVADNPGRREQESGRYLVGPSGKIAEKFFRDNPALGIDFRKNVIILNKTPVHTPRTVELRELSRMETKRLETMRTETVGAVIAKAIEESQRTMASLLFEFHITLGCQVWITGYSEMKKGGIFEAYTETLKKIYSATEMKKQILLFRHFSMNQFTIDLKQQAQGGETIKKTLSRIGTAYRKKILNM
jgi:uracil-DNA glycosylase